ncbi:flagellar basal body-associated FliL family protein [Ammonifex thiophilus]|uniref:flagellar basal body-associated FliL family protein n=1 Tax=Ammonifex thiophilus TaxID=444093 RepID=UPI001403393E|nr:flagellar basal body-associated FliL family protein [Ammonifex thiophilus]
MGFVLPCLHAAKEHIVQWLKLTSKTPEALYLCGAFLLASLLLVSVFRRMENRATHIPEPAGPKPVAEEKAEPKANSRRGVFLALLLIGIFALSTARSAAAVKMIEWVRQNLTAMATRETTPSATEAPQVRPERAEAPIREVPVVEEAKQKGGAETQAAPGQAAKLAGGKKPAQPPSPSPLKTVSLDSIVVNLADSDTNHYLRVTAVLAVPADEKLAEVEAKKTELRDLMIQLLRHKTFAEVTEPGYPAKLGKELKQEINARLGGDKVKEIRFTEYLTQ